MAKNPMPESGSLEDVVPDLNNRLEIVLVLEGTHKYNLMD